MLGDASLKLIPKIPKITTFWAHFLFFNMKIYRGLSPYANFISANFITEIFKAFLIYLAYAFFELIISLLRISSS